jgi:hypothetical protein
MVFLTINMQKYALGYKIFAKTPFSLYCFQDDFSKLELR